MVAFIAMLLVRVAQLRRWHDQQLTKQAIPPWYHELLVETAKRLKLEQLPAIVFSDKIVTPAVYGVINPILFLPQHYTESLTREEAEHVLLHELAHLKRRDLWWHGLCLLLQIVYWFNPLLILARRQMQHVREICCDLTVANVLREQTSHYRQTLLSTARRLLSESVAPSLGLLGLFEDPLRLMPRLRWLERKTWLGRRPMVISVVLVTVITVVCVLPMGGDGVQSRSLETYQQSGEALPGVTNVASVTSTRSGAIGARGNGGEEVHISNLAHIKRTFLGITYRTEKLGRSELWLGDDRVSTQESGRQIILDRRQNQMIFIDHRAETFVKVPLPLDRKRMLSRSARQFQRDIKRECEVEDTGKTKKLLGRRCRKFVITGWPADEPRRSGPSTSTVWATTEVDFNLDLFQDYLELLRQLYNRAPSCRDELDRIQGIQMRIEMPNNHFPFGSKIVDQVMEIAREVPPPSAYAPPEGYEEEDRIRNLQF
jgi:hypothetical protein